MALEADSVAVTEVASAVATEVASAVAVVDSEVETVSVACPYSYRLRSGSP